MSLPVAVTEFLSREHFGLATSFCCSVRPDGRLLQTWGDADWSGLAQCEAGDNLFGELPVLAGGVPEDSLALKFLTIGENTVVHLYTLPHDAGHYVVLLDARIEHAELQDRQQAVNELRLLQNQQEAMIGRQNELITELVEAKAELDHLREEAERDSLAKSRFIAMMSHEFRTPLASIISYADMAMEDGVSANTIQKSLEAVSRSGRHLTSVVEAVLDSASLNSGNVVLNVRDFALRDIVEDLSAVMAPLAAEKGLSYSGSIDDDLPQRIRADDVRLRQVLVNILGNAVKFTVDGAIRLHICRAADVLVASVTDTGPGIDDQDRERVFRAFERGDLNDSAGTGLGLTISLRLAKLMGGELTLTSSPGEGCCVELRVPFHAVVEDADAAAQVLPTPSTDNLATRAVSVLVCDDDDDMLDLIEFYLHRAGYGLIASGNGSEAIKKAIAYQPDLVLMDVNVPGVSGIEAAEEMRKQGFANPIVALSASRLSEEEASRFNRYFRKPAAMQELLAEIKRLTHAA